MPRDFDKNDLSDLRKPPVPEETSRRGTDQGSAASAPAPEVPGFDEGVAPDGPPIPDMPEAFDRRASSGPAPERRASNKKKGIGAVIAMFAAGCLGVNLILGVVSMAVLGLGMSSCMRSCSDNPIGDSKEVAAFIADLSTNSLDLATFDALHGSIDLLQERMADRMSDDAVTMTADQIREAVAAGSWPKDEASDALSPRVWVRIAEISKRWLEKQTGETWAVTDFAYPFPDSGPVPVPAVRDEDSRCLCRLVCTQGEDKDLEVTVGYYRWAPSAYFESDLEESRAAAKEREELLEEIEDTGLLGERDYLLSRGDLIVWERGDEDELRDPEAFFEVATQLTPLLGEYRHVTLLVHDTPVVLGHNSLSSNYPNERPNETSTFAEARKRLLGSDYGLYLDHAAADALLGYYSRTSEEPSIDQLTGTLVDDGSQSNWRHPWRPPSEACVFDDALVSVTARTLGTTEDLVIVATEHDDEDTIYNSVIAWVIVPRGTFPETPDAFCTAANGLFDAYWNEFELDHERNNSMYLHIFELDEETIVNGLGEPATFEELREVAMAKPSDLEPYQFDMLLSVMPSGTLWGAEDDLHVYYVGPSDVGGTIALTRDWRYSEE